MGNFHVKAMYFHSLSDLKNKQKNMSPESLRTVLVNTFTFIFLFSNSLWFIDVDQMQGKEAGDNGSTEVLV